MAENKIEVDVVQTYSIKNLSLLQFRMIYDSVRGIQRHILVEKQAKEELLKAMQEEYENGK